MKVVVITTYEDSNSGCPSAVIELPEGWTEDDVYVDWCRKWYAEDAPRKKLLNYSSDQWGIMEISSVTGTLEEARK